jgi:hypothetical protein
MYVKRVVEIKDEEVNEAAAFKMKEEARMAEAGRDEAERRTNNSRRAEELLVMRSAVNSVMSAVWTEM